jgi:two-component sensor histidine kinase
MTFLQTIRRDTGDDGASGRRAAYRMGEASAETDLTIEETFELLEQEAGDVLTDLSADILGSIVRGYVDQVVRTRGLTRRRGTGRLSSHVARLAALHRINRAATASLRLEDVLSTIVEVVAETIDGDACSVFLYDSHSQTLILRATKGLNQAAIGRLAVRTDSGITGLAASTMRTQSVRVAHEHPAFFTYPIVGEDPYTSQVSIPLLLREPERLVGVMNIQSIEEREFDQDEITFLETAAGELSIAIENARLYSQTDAALHSRILELHALQTVNRELSGTLRLDELYPLIARKAAEIVGGNAAAIFRVRGEPDGQVARLATFALPGAEDAEQIAFPQATVEEVVTSCGAIAVDSGDVDGDSYLTYCAPMMTAHGILGALCVHIAREEQHTEDRLSLFQGFADSAALALENAELYDEATRGYTRASTLLQEMHHRVRNNLQTVAALLSMQARHATEQSNKSTLREAVARVQSIAAVHNLLSAENLTETTVASIVKHVVDEASINVVPRGLHVDFTVEGSQVTATSRQATILALLVNECVTNAIEHGMAGRSRGHITIYASEHDGMVEVTIEDDGMGIPADFDVERDSQLGLRIAQTLATSDLGGSYALVPRETGGARSIIRFPAQH